MFARYYTWVLMPILCFIIPIVVPVYFWKEDPWSAWYIVVFRILCTNHAIFLINSAAHHWGNKPYDKTISATENATVGIVACGEGWHNYHHAFPWDFKAAELGKYDVNLSGAFIALMAKIGWAYDLRTASLEVIQKRAERKGDGTLKDSSDPRHHMNNVWRTDHKETFQIVLNRIMEGLAIDLKTDSTYKPQLLWTNIILMAFLHFIAIYFLLLYTFEPRLYTWMWFFFIKDLGGFGVTGGAHRLWSHRSYKAKWPLRIILLLCFTVTAQNSLYDWVRNHRVHHKFSETDADPHNSKRGFFFAHVGWLLQKKHPEVIKKGKSVDMSDLLQDPIVAFHQKHFPIFLILLSVVIPIAVPYFLWNETFLISLLCCGFLRYVLSLNYTWLVNSAAHIWGSKPYNANIKATQNLAVSIVALGEGWHNYHHTFPWDYKGDEFGDYKFNVTTFWLDLFAKIGWAYDLKQPSKELVHKVAEKYGDGSRRHVNCPSPHEIDENGKATNCCQLEDEETENDSGKNID